MDLVPFIYIPRWKFPVTPRSRFQVVALHPETTWPPFAASNRPNLCVTASVNAPSSCPNKFAFEQLRRNCSAVQLYKRTSPAPPCVRMARAISSFPVPVSSSMRTVDFGWGHSQDLIQHFTDRPA